MTFSSETQSIFDANGFYLGKMLLQRLKPEAWPFALEDLPEGTVLVGGAVRDGLLNKQGIVPDLDFVLPSHAIETCKSLVKKYGGRAIELDSKRDIGRYVLKNWKIDLASQIGQNLEEDLLRRDFSVNAIALNLLPTPFLIDPSGGLKDLDEKKLVAIAEGNLIEDPLRILRALRLMSELNFEVDSQTESLLGKHAELLETVASERIKMEIERLTNGYWADDVIPLLIQLKLLEPWRDNSNSQETAPLSLKNVSSFTPNELKLAFPLVRLTHLLSDRGLVNLGFSRKIIRSSNLLRIWQQRNDGLAFVNLNELDRLQLHLDLETFLPAIILSIPNRDKKVWLNRWRDPLDPLFHPASPLDGNTLKETFQIAEGPWIGKLMFFLCKERAFGRLHNSYEAFELARYWLEHNQPFCD